MIMRVVRILHSHLIEYEIQSFQIHNLHDFFSFLTCASLKLMWFMIVLTIKSMFSNKTCKENASIGIVVTGQLYV